jgi:hypothetical protein
VPSLLWALTTNSPPLIRPTRGVPTRQATERRDLVWGRGAMPTKVTRDL